MDCSTSPLIRMPLLCLRGLWLSWCSAGALLDFLIWFSFAQAPHNERSLPSSASSGIREWGGSRREGRQQIGSADWKWQHLGPLHSTARQRGCRGARTMKVMQREIRIIAFILMQCTRFDAALAVQKRQRLMSQRRGCRAAASSNPPRPSDRIPKPASDKQ